MVAAPVAPLRRREVEPEPRPSGPDLGLQGLDLLVEGQKVFPCRRGTRQFRRALLFQQPQCAQVAGVFDPALQRGVERAHGGMEGLGGGGVERRAMRRPEPVAFIGEAAGIGRQVGGEARGLGLPRRGLAAVAGFGLGQGGAAARQILAPGQPVLQARLGHRAGRQGLEADRPSCQRPQGGFEGQALAAQQLLRSDPPGGEPFGIMVLQRRARVGR